MPGIYRRRWFPQVQIRKGFPQVSPSLSLSGQTATSHVGTFSEQISSTIHLTGDSATSHVGTLSARTDATVDLAGVHATSGLGVFSPTIVSNIHLLGNAATSAVGRFSVATSIFEHLTGLSATSAVGSLAEHVSSNIHLLGQQATTQFGAFSGTGFPSMRVFLVASNTMALLAPGISMYPTSDTINFNSASPYIIGSSQFYTIAQVSWDDTIQEEGTKWQFIRPFTHIIVITAPPTNGTPITLLYDQWNIGVTAGFEVTSYPVPFSFVNTSIIAEQLPPPDLNFTVNFTTQRAIGNPFTVFARYPLIVDDIYTPHTQYDPPNGFETYRPTGFQVLDGLNLTVYSWTGSSWTAETTLSNGTLFYSKRARAIFQIEGPIAVPVYTAGSGANILYPQALTYPLFGEGIGKNLLQDAFSPDAPSLYPAAYEVFLNPGDYDPWVPGP